MKPVDFFLIIAIAIAAYTLGYRSHPYEKCSRAYDGIEPDYLGECVWLKMQGRE